MTTAAPGLTRLTISTPQRRVDVALPARTALAELLPDLLRHAGVGLADEGQAHGGWLLRRAAGDALSPAADLTHQGVRDGEVLHLVPARAHWPELEYDDVVEAIADGAGRHGWTWTARATRGTALAAAGLALLLGLVSLAGARHGAAPAAFGVALLLLGAGTLASRALADAVAGVTLAGFALPYALLGGVVAGRGGPGTAQLLVGSVGVLLVGVLGGVGVGRGLRVFAGTATTGCCGLLGGLLGYRLTPAGAAAIVLAALVAGVAAVPLLAIRFGNLPMPAVTPTPAARPAPAQVFAAVARTDEILTGMLAGLGAAAVGCSIVLGATGGVAGRVLVAVAAGSLLLRARLFVAVRQRLPLLIAGAAGAAALLVRLPPGLAGTAVLAVLALLIIAAGTRYQQRAPGPYLGRAADVLDALCVVSAIPAACAVLGLYARIRGLAG